MKFPPGLSRPAHLSKQSASLAALAIISILPISVHATETPADRTTLKASSPGVPEAKTVFKDKPILQTKLSNTQLRGGVTESVKASPFLYGSIQDVPLGTKLHLSFSTNLNSQISKLGDDVIARLDNDVNADGKVILPGDWFLHGSITDINGQKRLGRDGYVEVEFDKIISPDGEIDLPFKAKFSTKDNELTAVSKIMLVDSGYITVGAIGGSILSVQLTGLPVAIATHGISVGAGAAIGGGLGLIGALKRKGKITAFFPGDEITVTTKEAITVPSFDPRYIPSAQKPTDLPHLRLITNQYSFRKDPLGDKLSRQLSLSVTINNETNREVSFFDLAVLSNSNQRYYPSLSTRFESLKTKVPPHNTMTADLTFNVGVPKHKYWLILLDRRKGEEIARSTIN